MNRYFHKQTILESVDYSMQTEEIETLFARWNYSGIVPTKKVDALLELALHLENKGISTTTTDDEE